MQSWAGRGQRADCLTEVDAAESLLLLGNSGDRCLPPSVQKQDGRRTKPQRSPTGDDTIATEGRWSWPPELPPPQVAAPIVQRFAVQRRARRTSGSLMLHQCPCGGIVRCNGLFGGIFRRDSIEIRIAMSPMPPSPKTAQHSWCTCPH